MTLIINNRHFEAHPGESLFDIVRAAGMIKGKLSEDPIAAKIAGRVFTLNYVPVREKDVSTERVSVRKAVAASGGVVRLLTYNDHAGRETYMRTAQFVLFLAIRRLWPEAEAKMSCTVSTGLYIKVSGAPDFSARRGREDSCREYYAPQDPAFDEGGYSLL